MLKSKDKAMFYANILLLLCAMIWGFAFVAQSVAMDCVGPFTFLASRNYIGAAAVLPVVLVRRKSRLRVNNVSEQLNPSDKSYKKNALMGGAICGIFLFIASAFQQVGIMHTTVGKAGFLTAFYMIMVPLISIFMHKKVGINNWVGIALGMLAAYLISIKEGFSIGYGDILVFICAICFSFQIIAVDYYCHKVDGSMLACLEFIVTAILATIPMIMFEHPTMSQLISAGIPILYAGLLSSGVAYTLQIVGQKYAQPTVATILMSMESVFALVGGVIILGQVPTLKEAIGCIVMFMAVIVSQLEFKKRI